MNNQNCFDFLIDLALDNKDFNWIKQIQEQKAQTNIEDCIDRVLKELRWMYIGENDVY